MGSVAWIALLVIISIGVALAVVIVRAKSAAAPGTAAVRAARVVGVISIVASGIGTIVGVVRTLFDTSVSVLMPVDPFWPSIPTGVTLEGLHATVVGGGFTEAQVDVAGLDLPARVWLAASELLQGGTIVVIALVIVMLCSNIMRQDPFRAALTRSIGLTGIAIIVGGLVWQVCGAIGGGLASDQVLGLTGGSIDTQAFTYDDFSVVFGLPGVGHNWSLDFWPIWIGLVLFALAAVFRYGEKLQRDTEGLV